jgi:Haem-binding domain
MRFWLRVGIVGGVVFALVQFIPVDRKNPAVVPEKSMYVVEGAPENVRAVMNRSCNDCHSNETRWPWYGHVAPASWMVASDVHEARRKMNLSEWANYSVKKRAHELEEICNEILDGSMPDGKYTWIHRSSKLTGDERDAVCEWTSSPHHLQ